MTQEEKKALEDAAAAARAKADQAHDAAAQADGADEGLNKAAEDAEDAALDAQAAVDAAVVEEPAAPEADAPEEPGDGADIDFEKELQELGGKGPSAKKSPELEKAERALFFTKKRVKELGGDPDKVAVQPVVPAPVAAPAPEGPKPEYITKDDLAETEVAKYARTEAERKVIMHHYRHSIQRSGNVISDIENAYMIAHKGRITRSFEEIRRATFSRPMGGGAPGRKPPAQPNKAPALSASDMTVMKRRGFVMQPDGSFEAKRYRVRYDKERRAWVTEKK